jgi:hypothetical protein
MELQSICGCLGTEWTQAIQQLVRSQVARISECPLLALRGPSAIAGGSDLATGGVGHPAKYN